MPRKYGLMKTKEGEIYQEGKGQILQRHQDEDQKAHGLSIINLMVTSQRWMAEVGTLA